MELKDLAKVGKERRYDIHESYERASNSPAGAYTQWHWDGTGPAYDDVSDGSIAFDLPMRSAVSSTRITGTITW
jgi:hypothetical protein